MRLPPANPIRKALDGCVSGRARAELTGGDEALGVIDQALDVGGRDLPLHAQVRARLAALATHAALGPAICGFWCDALHRSGRGWAEHADINDVMLASALVPDGVLVLHGPAPEVSVR